MLQTATISFLLLRNLQNNQQYKIDVHNAAGSVVLQQLLGNDARLSIKHLPKGRHLLIITGNTTRQVKFLKD